MKITDLLPIFKDAISEVEHLKTFEVVYVKGESIKIVVEIALKDNA